MSSIIDERVALAQRGENPWLVARMSSGWLVMCDKQVVPGQLILLADPVMPSLNALDAAARQTFLMDMALVGDALLAATDCFRVNYEILGNTDPALHAHIVPRYMSEPDERRRLPIFHYDWAAAEDYSEAGHGPLRRRIGEIVRRMSEPASR